MLRFTSFSLPRFLESLDLSGTPIRFLPESIKDLGLLRHLCLRNCNMLQALPELQSHLDSFDVSKSLSVHPRLVGMTCLKFTIHPFSLNFQTIRPCLGPSCRRGLRTHLK
jgi:Leucine-rich repeat (LRR) protein